MLLEDRQHQVVQRLLVVGAPGPERRRPLLPLRALPDGVEDHRPVVDTVLPQPFHLAKPATGPGPARCPRSSRSAARGAGWRSAAALLGASCRTCRPEGLQHLARRGLALRLVVHPQDVQRRPGVRGLGTVAGLLVSGRCGVSGLLPLGVPPRRRVAALRFVLLRGRILQGRGPLPWTPARRTAARAASRTRPEPAARRAAAGPARPAESAGPPTPGRPPARRAAGRTPCRSRPGAAAADRATAAPTPATCGWAHRRSPAGPRAAGTAAGPRRGAPSARRRVR